MRSLKKPKPGNGKQKTTITITIFSTSILYKDTIDCCLLLMFSVNTTEYVFHSLYSGFVGIWMQVNSFSLIFNSKVDNIYILNRKVCLSVCL